MESILKVSNIVLQLRIGYNDIRVEVVMQDPELCKELLEVILNVPIERVEYPELQKTIDIAQDARSVRLDVYVRDGHDTVYDIEMQTVHEEGLPKRSRYYQGMIDLASIEKGELYKNLNRSYVIFICTFDAFGRGESIYTFENMCREVPGLPLGDETYKIFLNESVPVLFSTFSQFFRRPLLKPNLNPFKFRQTPVPALLAVTEMQHILLWQTPCAAFMGQMC